jgi:hypothetical protein
MTDTMTSQNIDLSSWDTLHNILVFWVIAGSYRELIEIFWINAAQSGK